MVYRYKTPYGTFLIRPLRADPCQVELWIEKQKFPCGKYSSAREAASIVHAHKTGNEQWDTCGLDVPENLEEWLSTAS